jgi:hypothetical protein
LERRWEEMQAAVSTSFRQFDAYGIAASVGCSAMIFGFSSGLSMLLISSLVCFSFNLILGAIMALYTTKTMFLGLDYTRKMITELKRSGEEETQEEIESLRKYNEMARAEINNETTHLRRRKWTIRANNLQLLLLSSGITLCVTGLAINTQ